MIMRTKQAHMTTPAPAKKDHMWSKAAVYRRHHSPGGHGSSAVHFMSMAFTTRKE